MRNRRIRQHERAQTDIPARLPILGKNHLVEMRRHGNIRRLADDLVRDAPFAVCRVLPREIQRPGDDANGGEIIRKTAAKVLEMRPVVAVEAVTHLRAHVAQQKGLVHGLLAPLGVGGRHLVAAVVAGAEVVVQFGAEGRGDAAVFHEHRLAAVAVTEGQRRRRDVLGYPVRVAGAAVEGGDGGEGGAQVGGGAGEAVLEEAGGVDGGGDGFVGGGAAG